ncbi:carboxyl transferase domain-containing protein [Ensifer canadensis]
MAKTFPSPTLTAKTIVEYFSKESGELIGLEIGPGTAFAWILQNSVERFVAIATDPQIERGAVGLAEVAQMRAALTLAQQQRLPVVWLLDTSGIRVTEGVAGIAALRRLVQTVTRLRLDGIRMLAVNLGSVFGGMSMIAALCECCIVHEDALMAVSGPRLIAAADTNGVFEAADLTIVRNLIGGRARAERSQHILCLPAENAVMAEQIGAWLGRPPVTPTSGSLLRAAGELASRLKAGTKFSERENPTAPIATASGTASATIFVLENPLGVTAAGCLDLADKVLEIAHTPSASSGITIQLNAPGHSSAPEDEALHLGEYLAHLALVIAVVVRSGAAIDVVVTGSGGGAIQGALGGPATSVAMYPEAVLHVLSPAALAALHKGAPRTQPASFSEALLCGASDFQFPQPESQDVVE